MDLRSVSCWIFVAMWSASGLAEDTHRLLPESNPSFPAGQPLPQHDEEVSSIFVGADDEIAPSVAPEAVFTPEELPSEIPQNYYADPIQEQAIYEGSISSQMAGDVEEYEGAAGCLIGDFTFDFPRWYVRTDAIWLDRNTRGELTTATVEYPGGAIGNYRIEDNTFHHAPGMRVFVGRNILDGMTYFELGYTGLFNWESNRFLGDGTDIRIVDPNLNLGLVDMGFATFQDPERQFVGYSSILNDGELNIRSFMSPNFAVIFGMRFIAVNEELVIEESGTTTTATLPFERFDYFAKRDTSVENGILTAQLGGDAYFDITDDIRLNLLGKIGLGANFTKAIIRQTAQVVSLLGAPVATDSRVQVDEETVLSGVLDTGAGLDIRLTRNVVLYGGYHFAWLYNVAVAPEQGPNAITDPNGLQSQIENGSSILLYGPYVGLQVSWGGVD